MAMTVSEVARLSGVSVRTLHHYDEIGLLRASGRTRAGYRVYEAADLERLQQVLFFRELEFPLEEIGKILDDPAFDRAEALRTQRRLLSERAVRMRTLITAVDAAIDRLSAQKGDTMDTQEMFAPWQDANKYEAEAEQRWGDTAAYQESKRRTDNYTKEDWQKVMAEGDAIFGQLADLMVANVPSGDARAMDLAEAHRQHITRWFYTCTKEIHRALGEMYVEDARFTATIDKIHIGLSAYLRGAFAANASRD